MVCEFFFRPSLPWLEHAHWPYPLCGTKLQQSQGPGGSTWSHERCHLAKWFGFSFPQKFANTFSGCKISHQPEGLRLHIPPGSSAKRFQCDKCLRRQKSCKDTKSTQVFVFFPSTSKTSSNSKLWPGARDAETVLSDELRDGRRPAM